MPSRCVVGGCSNTHKNNVKLHRFPKTPLAKLWLEFVQTTRIDFREATKHSVICSDHFEPRCYWKKYGSTSIGTLLDTAVPSLKSTKPMMPQKRNWASNVFSKRGRKCLVEEILDDCSTSNETQMEKTPTTKIAAIPEIHNQVSCDADTDDASETDRAQQEESTEIKEQMYREKLAQLKQQIEQLHAGTLPEFCRKQKKLEQAFKERQKQIHVYHAYLMSKIEEEYEKEQSEIQNEFETKKGEVKENLITELQDKKKQIENERHTMELTGAFNSSMEIKVVTRKLRRRANEPAPTLNEKRRKLNPSQIVFALSEEEVNEDLAILNSGKTPQQSECRIENGKLYFNRQWFHTSQPVYLEQQKESSRICGVVVAIAEREIWIRKLSDGSKIRVFVSQLQCGKYTIKRRLL